MYRSVSVLQQEGSGLGKQALRRIMSVKAKIEVRRCVCGCVFTFLQCYFFCLCYRKDSHLGYFTRMRCSQARLEGEPEVCTEVAAFDMWLATGKNKKGKKKTLLRSESGWPDAARCVCGPKPQISQNSTTSC